ncbi:uncharacterized protein LOC108090590 [Drosophila ficusphila]|uniref:uncharacterized protein LOC108090590 n=1 Tax=Drosophila ficusphila TaxID=30025 RepID=UPI0007E6A14F|nr:uncharacterized protein LOC108090590 [Drosophila ficusphila]
MECRFLEFTNIKCTSMDKKFCEFQYCFIKATNRTYKHLSVRNNLYKVPVNQFSINAAFTKRSNGILPFKYNLTFDGCKMVADIGNPWIAFLFGLLKPHSNINHSCPFDHDIIVDKLPTYFLQQQFAKFFPFPEGDYIFNSNWISSGVIRANVRVHLSYG